MANLALKYRPQSFDDVVEQKNVVKILSAMCKQPELPNRNFLLVGPRGCGKAQPLDSLVLTTSGYIQMKDIKVGDEVFTAKGNVGKVSDIYPQGLRDIYQISLDDNTYIEVADNHLNEVWVKSPDSNDIEDATLETTELKSLFDSYKKQNPYCRYFGVNLPIVNWKDNSIALNISSNMVSAILKNFEPVYFFNSIQSRIAFLQVILSPVISDDLGSILTFLDNFVVNIDDKSISNSFAFLVRSLGCKDTISEFPEFYRHTIEISSLVYEVLFAPIVGNTSYEFTEPKRFITNIKYVGKKECQCIMIDHEDHTYISNNFIPTHNTTLGRIIAKELNEGQGQTIELDAASHSGVDTVRDIIQQAQLYPIGAKYKVFICDEVHAFSASAWAALLKTLEDQPAKSVFVLLTTNPEKIPATIISRVQKFQLSNISVDGIIHRLKYVIEQENLNGENIEYDEDALLFIAKLAKGGMRDALTLLDKALVYDKHLTQEHLKYSLNIPDYDDYFELLNSYAKKDYTNIMLVTSNVYNSGTNFVKWFEEFQSFVINIAKYVFTKDINQTMIPSYYLNKVEHYSEKHAQICLALSQVLVDLIAKISKTEYMEEVAISYLCQRR